MASNNANEVSLELPTYKSHQIKCFVSMAESTVDNICNNVSVEEYRQVLEKIKLLKKKPRKIYKTYSMLKETIKQSVLSELNEVLQEDNFDNKFCKLSDIINETECSDSQLPAWRPSGNVNEDLRSHMMSIKLKQKSDLELLLGEKEESINVMKSKLKAIQKEVHVKEDMLVELTNRINKSNEEITNDLAKLCTQPM